MIKLSMRRIFKLIGIIGVIFFIINLFVKFNLGFPGWLILVISIILYLLSNLKLVFEITPKPNVEIAGTKPKRESFKERLENLQAEKMKEKNEKLTNQ